MRNLHIKWDGAAIAELESRPEVRDYLGKIADKVRDDARANARSYYPASRRVQAIISRTGTDAQGAYADVGYDATQSGFVLWFSEVGTVKMSPRPHLRAAVASNAV